MTEALSTTGGLLLMNGRGAHGMDSLRTQLWPLPALAVALAVVLGTAMPALDSAVDGELPESVTFFSSVEVRKRPGRSCRPSRDP